MKVWYKLTRYSGDYPVIRCHIQKMVIC